MGASADDQGFEEFQQVYPVENDNTEKMAVAGTKEEAEAIYNYLENPNDSNQKEDHNRKGKSKGKASKNDSDQKEDHNRKGKSKDKASKKKKKEIDPDGKNITLPW